MNHTKGPWEMWEIFEGGPSVWAKSSRGTCKQIAGEIDGKENARLIAAAPEMLAALERSAKLIVLLVNNRGERACRMVIRDKLLDQVNSAIAKATGGTP
jgi:hypothetical protein